MQTSHKSDLILDAALPVFVRFGFRKTSMADIARAAKISRASLYLSFNSKEELFRAGSARAHARTIDQVELALAGEDGVFGRIEKAIVVFQRGLIAPFGGSADPEELFAANMALAADITLSARDRLLSLLSQTLTEAETRGEIDLGGIGTRPDDLAGMTVAAMNGIKDMHGAGPGLDNGTRLFMRLLQAAVTPPAVPRVRGV